MALLFGATSFLWTCSLAAVYDLPPDGSAVIGTDQRVRLTQEDTLLDVARRSNIGLEEIVRANPGVNVWVPGEGTEVSIPSRRILPGVLRDGIVVNLPEHRLYYYPKPKKGERPVVITYPVGIGSAAWQSPIGQTAIISKEKHPRWYPTESIRKEHAAEGLLLPRVVMPGPDNPLGDFKMRLGFGDGSYEIHSTNTPAAVGMAITHGCILMYPEDLATLFPMVPVGTRVSVIDEPVKMAFAGGELLLEVHPALDGQHQALGDQGQAPDGKAPATEAQAPDGTAQAMDGSGQALPGQGPAVDPSLEQLSARVDGLLGGVSVAIHWDFAREALLSATGTPTLIGLEVDDPNPNVPAMALAIP